MSGAGAQTSAVPGHAATGYGRGIAANPVGMTPQQMSQGQTKSYSSSPQSMQQALQSPAQAPSQKSQSSPAPGSPVVGEPRIISVLNVLKRRNGETADIHYSGNKFTFDQNLSIAADHSAWDSNQH